MKFALVVMFYMHLKYDSRFFSTVFVGGLVLAIAVVVAVMALFQVLSAKSNPPEVEAAAAHTETVDGGEGPSTPPTPPEGPVDTEPEPSTDLVARGQEIFTSAPASVGVQALWCSACHTIEGVAIGLIGPDLTHIGTEGAGRKPGTSAEAYIRESIMEPEDFVAEGVDRATKGLMTNAVTKGLNKDQVDALVAFPAGAEVNRYSEG